VLGGGAALITIDGGRRAIAFDDEPAERQFRARD